MKSAKSVLSVVAESVVVVGGAKCGGLAGSLFFRPDFTPKPKGYNRIDLPPHRYRVLGAGHPYAFEYSQYAKVLRDSSYLAQPDWLNVYYPQLHANIQITYTNVQRSRALYNKMMEDARKLTGKHQIKPPTSRSGFCKRPTGCAPRCLSWKARCPASFSSTPPTAPGTSSGPRSTSVPATANDSLAPVIEYVKYDMIKLLNSLQYTK